MQRHSGRVFSIIFCLAAIWVAGCDHAWSQAIVQKKPAMYFSDTSRLGRPFAKDPSVIEFRGRYLMYYTMPPPARTTALKNPEGAGWSIGIAASKDLTHWSKVAEMSATQAVEEDGVVAPGARVIGGKVHLFYQSYGHGAKDAICHAYSADGIHFIHDPTNPVYRPTQMPWSVGRAIDAEILLHPENGKAYLYFATRDSTMTRQLLGMAEAELDSGFGAGAWKDVSTKAPVLAPQLPWEQLCIEAPSIVRHGETYFMFYAGAYNNQPQQIGVASSADAVHWTRLSDSPFLPNGAAGTWNSSESGHPGVLETQGKTYLFFQGNNDHGHTYFLSMVPISWKENRPVIAQQ